MPLIRKDTIEPKRPAPAARLTSLDADERWTAARELGGRPETVGPLATALRDETDERVREAIFTALARTGTAEAAMVLLPYLRLDDANLRTAALDALRSIPDAGARRTAALLQDPDTDVRILACELARSLTTADATALLSAVLERDLEPNVCACAVEVLAELGGPEALPALARCAERFPDLSFLRFAIKVAAARIGGSTRA